MNLKEMKILLLVLFRVLQNFSVSGSVLISHNNDVNIAYSDRIASYMNTTADPCEDFYQYACGNFFNVNKENKARGIFGSITLMKDKIENQLKQLLMQPVIENESKLTAANKAQIYYQSCMAENIFDYKKVPAYLNIIQELGGWPVLNSTWEREEFDWFNAVTVIKSYGINIILNEMGQLLDGTSLLSTEQFGLFPIKGDLYRPRSRGYQKNKEVVKHIMMMYGVPKADIDQAFNEIMAFGRAFAQSTFMTKMTTKGKNVKMSLEELQNEMPEYNWRSFYTNLYPDEVLDSMNITVIDTLALHVCPQLIQKNIVRFVANYIFLKFLFEMHDEIKFAKNKEKYCIDKVKQVMSPVLSAMYLNSEHYDKNIEKDILEITKVIRAAFIDRISSSTWLDDHTRTEAIKRIDNIEIVIGDSKHTLDVATLNKQYSNVSVNLVNGFYINHLNLRKFAVRIDSKRKPFKMIYNIDVNAFYDFINNDLIIPAGIFREPFYNPNLPSSYNFGVIGHILGHEFAHALDNNRKIRNPLVAKANVFSNGSDLEYNRRTSCFIDQYSKYKIEETYQNIKGRMTLPENIADNEGLRISFNGYKKYISENEDKRILPGLKLTNNQIFFVSLAQVWCEKIKGFEAFKNNNDNMHTPAKWRVIGTLSNFDEFSNTFECRPGTKMNPLQKCVIW